MAQRFTITLTQLHYFAECAKTLNMTAASQELHIAQSAISTAISHLERSLGAALFIRHHSKGLTLTSAGESLLRDTQRLFSLLSESIESIQTEQREVRGAITIACFTTLAPFLLPPLISVLRAGHPDLELEIIEGDHEDNLAALRSGRAELAINYDLTSEDDIDHETVGEARPHVILPRGHRLADRDAIALRELAGEPLVLLDLPDSREYFVEILRTAGLSPTVNYRSSSYETVRSMVATGLGFSILNQRPRINETYSGRATRVLSITDDVRPLGITVSSLAQVRPSARARAVAEAVRHVVNDPAR